jgi:hypothetical protein
MHSMLEPVLRARLKYVNSSTFRPTVMPFARALTLLGAYTPADPWLGNRTLAARTGLPAVTVARQWSSGLSVRCPT